MQTFQPTCGVCFAGLENTLRGDIRIDNHMNVGGSDMESGQPPPFLNAKLNYGVSHGPSVLMPAQLESRFGHRFASMILKPRSGSAPAKVTVRTPAAITQQVGPVSRKCQQVSHSLESRKWAW